MFKKPNYNLLIIALLLVNNIHAQSPWSMDKGKAYVQVGFSGLFYNQAEIKGKTVKYNGDFTDITIQAYSEYGITNKLEAQLIVPFKNVGFAPNVGTKTSFSAIGNITLGLKYKFFDKNWKISSGVQILPKTSQFDAKSGLSSGFNATTIIPYISAGSSAGKWYYFGNFGYGYMNNDYSDYIRIGAEVGYNVFPKAHIMLALETRNIVNNENASTNDAKQWASYLDRQTYNALGLKINYEFVKDKFGANFSAFGAFGNNNAPLAPSLNFGLYTKL
jgi:hypothetical protein